MVQPSRMFDIIQMLRASPTPLTAEAIALRLEVTKRTVYRDIAALQASRVPIEGAAGVGYVMRRGYDLPPLMWHAELGKSLQDMWTGNFQRGVQLHLPGDPAAAATGDVRRGRRHSV